MRGSGIWRCAQALLLAVVASAEERRLVSTFNPMTVGNTAGAPAAAGSGITATLNAAMNGNKKAVKANAAEAVRETPEAIGRFVSGFISAYFANVVLEPGEKTCIKGNIYTMTKATTGLLTQVGTAIAQLVAKETPNALGVISGLSQVMQVVTTVQNLLKGCIRSDSVAVMQATFKHLRNPQYVQNRFLANGIDIARVFADAIPAYEAGNFEKVGGDFGTLLRKILLSRNSGTAAMVLPEGMQKQEVGTAIVDGVVDGMFVTGTTIDIKNAANPNINIHIDLHKCFAKEAKYFSAAMNALYLAVAQITTNIEQWQLNQKGIKTQYAGQSGGVISQGATGLPGLQMDWMDRLSGVMMNVPVLMARCGFSPAQEAMMKQALKTMKTNEFTFNIPGPKDRVQAGNMAAVKFSEAAEEWKVGHYKDFGFLLGGLMRDLLLTIFPQKYGIDKNGQLSEYVNEKLDEDERPTSSFSLMVAGFCASMFVGLAVVRTVRSRSRSVTELSLLTTEATGNDLEGCSDVQSLE